MKFTIAFCKTNPQEEITALNLQKQDKIILSNMGDEIILIQQACYIILFTVRQRIIL